MKKISIVRLPRESGRHDDQGVQGEQFRWMMGRIIDRLDGRQRCVERDDLIKQTCTANFPEKCKEDKELSRINDRSLIQQNGRDKF